jgi:capsular exopolysaccharide synthesis family protein
MSYIFEALQRAEAERAGGTAPKNAESVADLLQSVEQEIARKQLAAERAGESLSATDSNSNANPSSSSKTPASVADMLQEVEREMARERALAVLPAAVAPPAIEAPKPVGEAASIQATVQAPVVQAPTVHAPVVLTPAVHTPPARPARVEAQEVQQRVQQRHPQRPPQPSVAPVAVSPRSRELEVAPESHAVELPVAAVSAPVFESAAIEPQSPEAGIFAAARVLTPALKPDSRLVCLTDQGGLASEKFRVLGLKLRHMRDQRKLKRIVITGTAPEEGKSLVAANLALNQSRSKVLKTLLIDGDLRRPTVATRFGIDRSLPGLSECLRGERKLSEVVYKLSGSGLWLLPAGRAPENPLDLMQGGRLPELLDELGKFFDWIIIDTPPVVPVADTTFWMKQADGVLIVIREGVSEKKVVERALDSFDRDALLGIVVNSCSRSDHKDYYSRYSQTTAPVKAGRAVSPSVHND